MQLVKYVVREDWRELTRHRVREHLWLWRGLQALVLLSTLASVSVFFLCPPQPWRDISYTVLSSGLFIGFSLWTVFRPERRSYSVALIATLLLAGAAAAGVMLRPRPGRTPDLVEGLLTIAGGLAMVSSWGILAWAHGQDQEDVEQLGLTGDRCIANALLGGAAGATLGAHLMVAGHFAGLTFQGGASWTVFVWQLAFWAGLRSLGQELLLRGVGFHVVRQELERSFWATAVPLAVLNVPAHLAAGSHILKGSVGPWIVGYIAVMALLNTALREWRGSLIACVACNVVFNAMVLVTLGTVI